MAYSVQAYVLYIGGRKTDDNSKEKLPEWNDNTDIILKELKGRESKDFELPPKHKDKTLTETFTNLNATIPNFSLSFYIVDCFNLHRNSKNGDFFARATLNYYLMEAGGPPFWKAIQESKFEYVDKFVGFFHKMFHSPPLSIIQKRNSVFSPIMPVLNNPYFVAHLPWNPSLFHYWLISIHYGLLQVEESTSQLRLWPMAVEKAKIVRNFLIILRDLKKKIAYGFLLLGEQIKIHPKKDPKVAQIILEDIVLPLVSLTESNYLSEAEIIAKSLSDYVIETRSTKFAKGDVILHFKDYIVSSDIDDLVHIYDIKFWYQKSSHRKMFGTLKNSLQDLSKTLNMNNIKHKFITDLTTVPAMAMDSDLDSKCFHVSELLKNKDFVKSETSHKGRESYDNMAKVQTDFELLQEMFRTQLDTTIINMMMRNTLSKMLDKEIAPKLTPEKIKQQLKDPIGRNGKKAFSFNDIKHKCLQWKSQTLTKHQLLKKLAEKTSSQRIDPDLQPPSMRFSKRTLEELVHDFENRIRTLLYNIFQDNFGCLETEELVYPETNFVQFMLPCYVVSFLQTAEVKWKKIYKNEHSKFYLANFIHTLIQQQERSFLNFRETRKVCSIELFLHESSNFAFLMEHTKRLGNSYLPSILINAMLRIKDHTIEALPYMSSRWDKLFMASLNQLKFDDLSKGDFKIFRKLLISHLKALKLVNCAIFSTQCPLPSKNTFPVALNISAMEMFEIVCIDRKPLLWEAWYSQFAKNAVDLVNCKSAIESDLDFQNKIMWHNVNNFTWSLFQLLSTLNCEWSKPKNYQAPSYFPKESKDVVKYFLDLNLLRFKFAVASISINKERENLALLSKEEYEIYGDHVCGLLGEQVIPVVCTKQCRACGEKDAELRMCHICLEYNDYPDVNWFCGENCENRLLDESHNEEHCQYLVQKLGI